MNVRVHPAASPIDGSVANYTEMLVAAVSAWTARHSGSVPAARCAVTFFPAVTPAAAECSEPSIVAVHHVQHRLQPHFEEFAVPAAWNLLEGAHRRIASRATMVVAESATGRADLLDAYGPYGLTPDRIMVVPYTVPQWMHAEPLETAAARVRLRYRLPDRFLFYPAQFLPHRNHAVLIDALGTLARRYNLRPLLVLAGEQKGGIRAHTSDHVRETARRAGVADQVRSLGFIPNADVAGLHAAADVMAVPGCLGPSSLAILEAWSAGTPVLASNTRGIREMCEGAASLVDPGTAEDMSQEIRALWTDADRRAELVRRGSERLTRFSADAFRAAVGQVLDRTRAMIG